MDIYKELVESLGRHDGEEYVLSEPIEYNALCTRLCNDSGNWQDKSDKWVVTIGKELFEYYTGIGLRKQGKPVKPSLGAVLWSLSFDFEACEMSFNEWCMMFDYNNDLIKARGIYDECQRNADKLNKAGVYIDSELKEFLNEY